MELNAQTPEGMCENVTNGLIQIVIAVYLKVVQTAD